MNNINDSWFNIDDIENIKSEIDKIKDNISNLTLDNLILKGKTESLEYKLELSENLNKILEDKLEMLILENVNLNNKIDELISFNEREKNYLIRKKIPFNFNHSIFNKLTFSDVGKGKSDK